MEFIVSPYKGKGMRTESFYELDTYSTNVEEQHMKLERKMDTYCEALMGATRFARVAGVDSVNVINGLVGTVALSIKSGGGNNGDVADVFRTFADCYEEKASGQHCRPLRSASVG